MPELPEVETTGRGLSARALGKKLAKVEVRVSKLRLPIPPQLARALVGQTLEAVTRRAKYLLLGFSGGHTLLLHLGMSGRLVFAEGRNQAKRHLAKHDHIILHFAGLDPVIFNDPRRFGLLALCPTAGLATHPLLAHLGPEPLQQGFCGRYLHHTLQGKTTPIKVAILDQTVVVGVGNIYASEALFRAGVRPQRPAGKLTRPEADRLAQAIKDVLRAAIKAGGSTLRDYVQADGQVGYFFNQFNVYDRAGQACHTCGTPIKQLTQAGRSTYYCPVCQPR